MDEVERADRILARLADDPKIQKVVSEAHLFSELREQPGWQRLYERVAADKSKVMRQMAARLMGPKSRWPTPEEIAYHRGFYQGATFVLAHPEHAERNLQKAADAAWLMTLEEDDAA